MPSTPAPPPSLEPSSSQGRALGSVGWRNWSLQSLVLIAAIGLAYRSFPSFGLIGDAEFLIENNQQMRDLANWWVVLSTDYFDATHAEQIGYWRPLTKFSWLLETTFGGGNSSVYHWVQVFWLMVAAFGVRQLALMLGACAGWSLAAGLFFGLHPALVEPACLVMARSDLVCGAGVVWALVGWLQWRRAHRFGLVVHLLGVAVACASKEASLVLPIVLLVWALLGVEVSGDWKARASSLVPVASCFIVYLSLRSLVVSSVDSPGVDLSPSRLLALWGAYVRGLVPFPLESTIRNMPPGEALGALSLARGVGAVVVSLAVGWLCWKRFRAGLGLLVWAVASLALVILPEEMRVPGAEELLVLSDRWLLHAVAACAVGLAVAGGRVLRGRAMWSAWVLAGAWGLLAVVAGPQLHAAYADRVAQLDLEDADYLDTPERFRTGYQHCRFVERALIRARLDADVERLLELLAQLEAHSCELDNAEVTALSALLQAGDLARARGLADRILQRGITGRSLRSLPLVGWALLATGDAQRAAIVLQRAHELEPARCPVILQLAQARASLQQHDVASQAFELAFRCAGDGGDPQWLVAASDMAQRAGDARRVQQLTAELNALGVSSTP